MRMLIVMRGACLLLLALLLNAEVAEASPGLHTLRNTHFEVIGLDRRSVAQVNELSQQAVEVAGRYLDRTGMAFPLPILVSLRPAAHADFEAPYRIRFEARGAVELDIRWEATTTLEMTCRALSEALLMQYAVFNHGRSAPAAVRLWTVDALARAILLSLRPANFFVFLADVRAQPVPPLSSVLESSRAAPGEASLRYGYWLLESMQTSGLDRKLVRSLFQQALMGADIQPALTAAMQPDDPTAEGLTADSWWDAQMRVLLDRDYDVIETMGVTREWLSALARFDLPLTTESGEVSLNLRSLRMHRNEPQVRGWVEARYNILRLRMVRANPAYFNAARSLGVLFESLLSDAPAHQYLHALTIYLSDWEDAKDLQSLVEENIGRK